MLRSRISLEAPRLRSGRQPGGVIPLPYEDLSFCKHTTKDTLLAVILSCKLKNAMVVYYYPDFVR